MYPSTSFKMQIANFCVEICGYNDVDSSCLQGLKRLFRHHEVGSDTVVSHRIVVCASYQFEIPPEATLRWVSTCLGVAGSKQDGRRLFFVRFFVRNKEIPQYSGTDDVRCYKDSLRQEAYYVPNNAEWRIKHVAKEHVTYVYPAKRDELSGLSSMLLHVIGSQFGCYLLFASCVSIDGEALLFTGNGGVGKTLLCMELMKQGATYIGDDLVLVYRNGERAIVGSLLFPIKCYANRIHSKKSEIDVVSQLPQRPPLNVPLQSIYLLRRADNPFAESYLKPMQGERMFETMLSLTNKANTNADVHHFVDTVSSICGSVPCSYLFFGEYNKINLSFFADHDQR